MAQTVKITPASGLLEFIGNTTSNKPYLQHDDNGNLTLTLQATKKFTVAGNLKVNGKVTMAQQTLTDGAAITWDFNSGANAKVTLAGARTLVISNMETGDTGLILVKQDAAGSRTLTLPGSSSIVGGGSYTASPAANATDVLGVYYDGTTYWWTIGYNTVTPPLTSVGITGGDFVIANSPLTANGNIGLALATVNSTVGTFGSATAVPVITVNAKGLVTAVSATNISIPTNLDSLTDVTITSAATNQLLQFNGSQWVNWTPNYITSYTETDTLATVTGRGATTNTASVFGGGLYARGAQNDGDYSSAALWTESYNNTTTGIAFHISGIVGKFLEMRTDQRLYWDNEQVWHTGNLTNLNQLTNGPGYITGYTETNTFLGDGGSANTHPGTDRIIFTGQLSLGAAVLGMPSTDNSNAILNINRHPGEYNSQLGFSSNGSMYYRSFSATAINNTQAWRQVWDSDNLTNLNQLTNGPAYITTAALSGYATQTYVNTAISNLIDTAPSTLDTLNELAAALGDDPNFATSITTSIGNKVSKSGDTMTGALTINTTGTGGSPSLRINTSTAATFVHSQENLAANLTAGQHNILVVGKAADTKNSGYIGYNWAANASDSNFVTIGHWGADDLLRVYGNGVVTIGTNTVWHAGNDGAGSGLDADLLDGYHASGSVGANTVVIRDANGYIYANYINTNVGVDNPSIANFITDSGDGWMRKSSIAHVRNSLGNYGSWLTQAAADPLYVNITGDSMTGPLVITGTTSGQELFAVNGVNGRLFTVSDDLSNSLFSVNTVAGLPVIEAFANNTVNIGPFSAPIVINASGIATPSHGTSANWNSAYNDTITSAAVSGTTSKTLTLTQRDGGTVTATWTDIDTDTDTDQQTLSVNGSTLSISGGNSITLPASGISQATADGLYVNISGDEMTGNLYISPISANPAQIQLAGTNPELYVSAKTGTARVFINREGSGHQATLMFTTGMNVFQGTAWDYTGAPMWSMGMTNNNNVNSFKIAYGDIYEPTLVALEITTANTAYFKYVPYAAGNLLATQSWVTSQGYITSYSETDTLASVTARGSSTNGSIYVNGLLTGGLGAATTEGTLDWNDSSNARAGQGHTLLLGNHSNGPGPGEYFHPVGFEYSSKNGSGNVTQLAISYGSPGNKMYMRGKYGGSWTGWTQFITSANIGGQSVNYAATAGALTSMNISQFTNNSGYLTSLPSHNHDDRYYTESEIDSQIGNRLYQARVNSLDVDAFNGTGLYRGSTSSWSNRPPIGNNAGALLQIDTHPSDYAAQLFFDSSADRLYLRNAAGGSWGSWNTMWHSGNDGAGSGLDADLLDGFHASVAATANSIPTRNASGYLIPESWIQFNGTYGLYSPTNNAHLRPNSGSYGSWQMTGSRGGWQGIEFDSGSAGNISLMVATDSNTVGFHNNNYGWQFRWNGGTLYVYKNAYGAGTEATVLDSVNYTNYAATSGHTHDLGRYSLSAPQNVDGLTSSNFRSTLFGLTNNTWNISTARWNTTPAGLSGMNSYGTMFAWSGSDTHGFIATDYSTANIQVGGGSENSITWKATLIHSSNIGSQSVSYATTAGSLTSMNISQFTNNSGYLTSITSGNVTTALGYTPWHAGNDGAGSGLDADLLDGYTSDTAANVNTIVRRDASGNIYSNYVLGSYFNASAGNSANPTIGQIWTQDTSDNYLRKSTPAHFRSQVIDGYYLPLSGGTLSGSLNIIGELAFRDGSGDYSNIIRAAGYPSEGYDNSAIYWLEYQSRGGHHFVLNTDSGVGAPANTMDDFVIWQGAIDGDRILEVSNTGTLTIADRLVELSSIRYKTNVESLTPALDKVLQLRPVYYTKIGGTGSTEIGLIAEEVSEIYPELVKYDSEGQVDGINYTRIAPILIKTIQEQQELIKKLTERIENLENR